MNSENKQSLVSDFSFYVVSYFNTFKNNALLLFSFFVLQNMMFDDYLDDFLKRIAVTRLGMHRKQFEDMLASQGKNVVIDRLLELADKKGVEIPNIDNLFLSITRNFDIAQKASNNWVPGKVIFI